MQILHIMDTWRSDHPTRHASALYKDQADLTSNKGGGYALYRPCRSCRSFRSFGPTHAKLFISLTRHMYVRLTCVCSSGRSCRPQPDFIADTDHTQSIHTWMVQTPSISFCLLRFFFSNTVVHGSHQVYVKTCESIED